MSLSRYNSPRSKSRSPAPPPRPFLPPSHYAAAAGLPYPNDHMPVTDYGDSRDTILPSTSSSVSPNTGSRNSFRTVSYASQLSNLASSSFDSTVALGDRQSNLKRRQSNLGDLPMLEAQLLPSLRDTIDRMTKPSRTSIIEPPRSPFLEPPDRPGQPTSISSSSSPSASSSSFRRAATPQSMVSPTLYSTPRSAPPTPSQPPNSRPKLKSVLKSALRPPTPKLSTNQATTLNPTSQSSGGFLRITKTSASTGKKVQVSSAPSTMVADIKRGAGIASYAKLPSPNVRPEDQIPVQQGRARSRTDPGSAIKTPAVLPPSAEPNSLYNSRLPRRHELPRSKHPEDKHLLHADDNGKGKSNTIVPPSSSGSESSRTSEKSSRLPKPKDQYTQTQVQAREGKHERFGLGLGDYGAKLRGIFADSTNRIVEGSEDESSVYEEDLGESRQDGLSDAAGMSGSTSDWQSQDFGVDQRDGGFSRRPSYEEEPPDSYRKRREALLGIVQGLEQGPGPKARVSRNSSVLDDGDYSDPKGLAISDSRQFDAVEPRDFEHTESRDQHKPQYRPNEQNQIGRQDYRRNNCGSRRTDTVIRSPLPTFKISTDDDDRRQGLGQIGNVRSLTSDRERPPRPATNPSQNGSEDNLTCESSGRRSIWQSSPAIDKTLRSRSPVVRNKGTGMPPVRQTDLVHRGPSPERTPLMASGERYDRRRRDSGRLLSSPQHVTFAQQHHELSDISSAAENSYAAATRQREAFGIPRPISDYYTDSIHEVASQELPHANSDLSSVGDDIWREDCDGFSAEAESLFEKLGGVNHNGEDPRRKRSSTKDFQTQPCRNVCDLSGRSHSALSQNSDASSVYDEQIPEPSENPQGRSFSLKSIKTWRSDIPPSVYHTLLEQYGEVEIHRQEVIWELCETECMFVNHLHGVVRLFVRPLRAQNSKTWITGVPAEVARLFDWLEDIVNLHSHILAALQAARKGPYSMVDLIAESLRVLVPRLEVYQPYLVRLEDVAALIERLGDDEQSDFGEFVTLQESSTECDGWGLERFLIEPVNRLSQYPEFFRRLLGVTPSSHPDYLPTFSLLHSTNLIIRVMSEVKFREDEYDVVKDISTRIHGLPSSAQLARRERRLLAQGTFSRLHSAPHLLNLVSTTDAILSNRNSKLMTAVNDWGVQRDRSGSVKSTSTTTMSFRSYDTISSCSSGGRFDSHHVASPLNLQGMPNPGYRMTTSSQGKLQQSPSLKRPPETIQSTAVNVFVFTDLVVFATPIARRESNKCQNWRLLEDIGIARILAVTEGPEVSSGTRESFVLDLLPMNTTELETGIMANSPVVVPLYLSVLDDAVPGSSLASFDRTRTNWLSVFRQCSQFTLRSLSFLSYSGGRLDHGPEVDLELDTHQSVLAIMASGLPLPKSPSVQLEEVALGESGSARQQEREERGWWSLRFQQVLREMQRHDTLPVVIAERRPNETA